MTRILAATAVALLSTVTAFAQQGADEQSVWKLEHSYWEFVKAQDLASYKALWHENFLGWPSYSPQPVRKDQITDWLNAYSTKGRRLKAYSFDSTASQATGDLVVVDYKVTTVWTSNDGSESSEILRITHTWLRGEKGWQIISAMSAREPQTQT